MRRVTRKDRWGKLTNNQVTRWVGSRHDNMKARSQWKIQATCHITWMHTADKNTNYVQQHKIRGQESARPSELETALSHNKTGHGARVSEPRHKPKLKTWVPGCRGAGIRTPDFNMKQGTQTRERTARAHSKPRTYIKSGHDGSVRALSKNPWITPDWSDRTLTVPPE